MPLGHPTTAFRACVGQFGRTSHTISTRFWTGREPPGLPLMHVFYSFPDVVGKPGIGVAALHNVLVLAEQGVDVTLVCTSVSPEVELAGARDVVTTLTAKGHRIPHRALGIRRAYRYHDWRAARVLNR